MSSSHEISKLDDLIVTTIDSVNGYDYAADHVEAGRFANFFREMAAERRQVVDALQAESRRLGGTPAEKGSVAGAVHRAIEGLRSALGGADAAVASEAERGEKYLKEEFDRVLADEKVNAETLTVVRGAYSSVVRGLERTTTLHRQADTAS